MQWIVSAEGHQPALFHTQSALCQHIHNNSCIQQCIGSKMCCTLHWSNRVNHQCKMSPASSASTLSNDSIDWLPVYWQKLTHKMPTTSNTATVLHLACFFSLYPITLTKSQQLRKNVPLTTVEMNTTYLSIVNDKYSEPARHHANYKAVM